jgi:hypothetical protein
MFGVPVANGLQDHFQSDGTASSGADDSRAAPDADAGVTGPIGPVTFFGGPIRNSLSRNPLLLASESLGHRGAKANPTLERFPLAATVFSAGKAESPTSLKRQRRATLRWHFRLVGIASLPAAKSRALLGSRGLGVGLLALQPETVFAGA